MPPADKYSLYDAMLALKNPEECRLFLCDLCTPKEREAMEDRWKVSVMIDKGLTYREIQQSTGVSLTTICRVGRCLKHESYNGYKLALENLKK